MLLLLAIAYTTFNLNCNSVDLDTETKTKASTNMDEDIDDREPTKGKDNGGDSSEDEAVVSIASIAFRESLTNLAFLPE